MFDIAHRTARAFRSWLRDRRYRFRSRLAQWRRASRYATDRLSADDAQRMMLDCRDPAGWYPLLVLTVEDTLEQAREDIADHPKLPRLIADVAPASPTSGNPTMTSSGRRGAGLSVSPGTMPPTRASC